MSPSPFFHLAWMLPAIILISPASAKDDYVLGPDSQRQEDYPKDMAGQIKIAADAAPGARYWQLATSLRKDVDLYSASLALIPTALTVEHYARVFAPNSPFAGQLWPSCQNEGQSLIDPDPGSHDTRASDSFRGWL